MFTDTKVEESKRPSINLSDRLFATLQLAGFSMAWSFIFLDFFRGLYVVKQLFPWITDSNVLMAIIFVLGITMALLLGIIIERRRIPFTAETFLYSAAHIGLLASLYSMPTSSILLISAIVAVLVYLGWFVVIPLIQRRFFGMEVPSEKPSFPLIVVFLLISLLYLPSTSPIETQTSGLRPTRELQYYIAPIEYSDEESFEADLRITSDNWENYSNEEKLERLSMIVEYECNNILGCEAPRLAASDLGDGTNGMFIASNYTIVLDESYLTTDPLDRKLETLIHESRHAYQYACRNMIEELSETNPDYLRLAVFREPLELSTKELQYNHYAYEDSWQAYINDPFESDARSYASARMADCYENLLDNAELE